MVAQVFVDDSGGNGHSRHFVLAGLASDSERWARFSTEWRACLDKPPQIKLFKMREAASLSGEFKVFSEQQRDERLRDLAKIINRYAEFALWTVIDLDAHAKAWAMLPKPQSEVYFWPFHTLVMGSCFDLWEECKWREPFEIVFDEQLIFGERARRWYPLVKEVLRRSHPEEATILPESPSFGKDDDHLPIQAADLFAWCLRRNTDEPGVQAFEWLLAEMPNVSQSSYCNYYDLDRMSKVDEESRRLASSGEVPRDLVDQFRFLRRTR